MVKKFGGSEFVRGTNLGRIKRDNMVLPALGGTTRHTDRSRPYGALWVDGNATADSVASGVNTQFLHFTNVGEKNHTIPSVAENHIEVQKDGIYMINVSTSFLGDASVDWSFHVHLNNGTVELENLHFNRKLGAGGDIGSASACGLVNLKNGDSVEVWYEHGAGVNKSITVQDCSLVVFKIG